MLPEFGNFSAVHKHLQFLTFLMSDRYFWLLEMRRYSKHYTGFSERSLLLSFELFVVSIMQEDVHTLSLRSRSVCES